MNDGASKLMGLPKGRYDGHGHVFVTSLPMDGARRYTPGQDAPLEDYARLLRDNHLEGALLVQPSFLGTDNHYLLQCLERARAFDDLVFRGVAVVSPGIHLDDLERLHALGVIGIRLNLLEKPLPDFLLDDWAALFESVNRLGWHVEVHLEGARLPTVLPLLMAQCQTVVLDHFGLPSSPAPAECAGMKAISKAASQRLFVKASAPYRVFPDMPSRDAAVRVKQIYSHLLQTLSPGHLIWGSDWPWTRFEGQHNFERTLDWRRRWEAPQAISSINCDAIFPKQS